MPSHERLKMGCKFLNFSGQLQFLVKLILVELMFVSFSSLYILWNKWSNCVKMCLLLFSRTVTIFIDSWRSICLLLEKDLILCVYDINFYRCYPLKFIAKTLFTSANKGG